LGGGGHGKSIRLKSNWLFELQLLKSFQCG
jgi:hypothetical protein